MNQSNPKRIALLYPGDRAARDESSREKSRFWKTFQAFEALGIHAEPAVYHDEFRDEVKKQLLGVQAVLCWVNPIEGGRDRAKLDQMLREVAAQGVYVSTHPDVILKLGTKEVLIRTRDLGWGTDAYLYATFEQLRQELPERLARGEVRVLKQYRGHSGDGIWKVEREGGAGPVNGHTLVRARHAKSGCVEETLPFGTFLERCQPYFAALEGQGRMVDQQYQPRLPEGMVRCYLVHGKVEGFGKQEIVALHPTEPKPTPRPYHPPTLPELQGLKHTLETEWVPAACAKLGIPANDLPALWDCDFLLGPKNAQGENSYVLCEINVSSVSPFPDSAIEPLVRAVAARL